MEEDKRVTAVASKVNILAAAARATPIIRSSRFAPCLHLPLLHKRHETQPHRPVCLLFVREIGGLRAHSIPPPPRIAPVLDTSDDIEEGFCGLIPGRRLYRGMLILYQSRTLESLIASSAWEVPLHALYI